MINTEFLSIIKSSNRALIIGIGGGGDVLGTLPTRRILESFGLKCQLGSLTYERSKYDPIPGPRPLDQINNIQRLNETIALANKNTKTKDGLIFQGTKMSRFLNEEIFMIDISKGVLGVKLGLEKLCEDYDFDLLIGIDVGGDVVANGFEKGLRSPLTDAIMLSGLAQIKKKSMIGVYGICCDGELTLEEISSRFTKIYSSSGFLGSYILSSKDIEEIKLGTKYVDTEASKLPLLISEGQTGLIKIRDGRRTVDLTFFSAFTYYFKTIIIYQQSEACKAISRSKTFLEANNIFKNMGITTEYELQLKKLV